jgi:hypothetical protein
MSLIEAAEKNYVQYERLNRGLCLRHSVQLASVKERYPQQVTPTRKDADYEQLNASGGFKSGRKTSAILGRARKHLVCPSRGTIHLEAEG